jgi:sugar/nucleoside kinase (ribokinase family)
MSKIYDVAGMGNAIVDVLAPVSDEFLLEHNIAKGVMTLVDQFRAHELYAVLGTSNEVAGGSAANTMAGLASLGGKGIFVGKVKDDRLGQSFAESLTRLGVRFATKMARQGAPTACCIIAVTDDGHRSMSTYLGASREISPADVEVNDIAASQVLYIEGYLWDQPEAKAAIEKAISAAKRAHGKVAFTLSDPFCVGRYREEFLELLRTRVDVLFANEEEVKALFEVESFDAVLQHIQPWHGTAALTRSAKGCVIARGSEVHVLDAVPVAQVVDSTGAGDQFAAGFLYGLTRGKDLAHCGRLGAMAAAEVISHYGARPEVSLRTLAAQSGLDLD